MIFQFFIYIILSTSFKYILKTYSKASLIKQIFYLKFYNFGCRLEGVIFTLKIGFITIDIGDIGGGGQGVYNVSGYVRTQEKEQINFDFCHEKLKKL